MRYRVNWTYASSLGGPWHEGQLVELAEDVAVAVDATSPGVLTPAADKAVQTRKPEPASETAGDPDAEGALAPATGQRQVKAARNRATTEAEGDR